MKDIKIVIDDHDHFLLCQENCLEVLHRAQDDLRRLSADPFDRPGTAPTRPGRSSIPAASASRESRSSIQFVARDRFDKRDDASSQAWLFYLHERLGEREPVDR